MTSDTEPQPPADQNELMLKAVSLLLSDISTTRFDLLMLSDRDPLEAAQEVIDSIGRYDFLAGLAGEASYQDLKKRVESSVSDRADAVIREQNPR